LIDPLGHLMLRWPVAADPSRMKKDLDRLLRASPSDRAQTMQEGALAALAAKSFLLPRFRSSTSGLAGNRQIAQARLGNRVSDV